MKHRNIILIGFMGTGKTTVGRMLAGMLNWRFADMDVVVEEEQGATVAQLFRIRGEPHFRKLETELLLRLVRGEHQVISTGGGAVLAETNRRLMVENGFVVALKADARTIADRVRGDQKRPLLAGDVDERIKRLLEERRHAYDFADCAIDTAGKSAREIAKSIIALREETLG